MGFVYNEIKKGTIEGGTMNRFVVFNVGEEGIFNNNDTSGGLPPNELIDAVRHVRWVDALGRDSSYDTVPQAAEVGFEQGAIDIFTKFKGEAKAAGNALESSGLGNMTRRWRENAMRLATILAAWECPENPLIEDWMAEWSCKLVRHCGEETIRQLAGKVSDSAYGEQFNAVLETVRSYECGTWVKKSDLLRRHRGIKSREMNDILSHLAEAGMILSQLEERKEFGHRPAHLVTAVPE